MITQVPEDLQAIPRWVLWRFVRRADGGLGKVPQRPGGGNGSAMDPANWRAYAQATAELERAHQTDRFDLGGGIGFVFVSDDDLGGIDLDGCRDPSTGAVARWAQEVLDLFEPAYIELSPSKAGFHVFARGAPAHLSVTQRAMQPAEGDPLVDGKEPFLEAYVAKRFFTVTGHRVSGHGVPAMPEAWAKVVSLLGGTSRAANPKADIDGTDLEEVAEALGYFNSDDVGGRNSFVGVGLAIKDAFGDEGFDTWNDWMARSDYDEGDDANRAMWESLPQSSEHISLASVFWRARKAGWKPGLDFDAQPPDLDFDAPAHDLDFIPPEST